MFDNSVLEDKVHPSTKSDISEAWTIPKENKDEETVEGRSSFIIQVRIDKRSILELI